MGPHPGSTKRCGTLGLTGAGHTVPGSPGRPCPPPARCAAGLQPAALSGPPPRDRDDYHTKRILRFVISFPLLVYCDWYKFSKNNHSRHQAHIVYKVPYPTYLDTSPQGRDDNQIKENFEICTFFSLFWCTATGTSFPKITTVGTKHMSCKRYSTWILYIK
jgi:hypothetical protein